MITHALKTWPEYFEAICDGRKRFELRKNDRCFKVGDILLLRHWDPATGNYNGRSFLVQVTYMVEAERWLAPGVVCLGIQVVK